MTTLNLHQGARHDERFHLQYGTPKPHGVGVDWLLRRVWWTGVYLPDVAPDGAPLLAHQRSGRFASWVVLWVVRWYWGTVKCDGTRTRAYWGGQLGEPVLAGAFVMTTTPKEMFSFRLRWRRPDRERWDNMGGI